MSIKDGKVGTDTMLNVGPVLPSATLDETPRMISLSSAEKQALASLVKANEDIYLTEIQDMDDCRGALELVLESENYLGVNEQFLPDYRTISQRFLEARDAGQVARMREILSEAILYYQTAKQYVEQQRSSAGVGTERLRVRGFLASLFRR